VTRDLRMIPQRKFPAVMVSAARELSALSRFDPLPVPIREESIGEEGTPSPGCFCEVCKNKGFAGASVRNDVKTRDLETARCDL